MYRDFAFELGEVVRDKVTGYKGVVRSRTQYLTGCNTYGLQSVKLDDKGVPADWVYLDEFLLDRVKGAKKIVLQTADKKPRPNASGPLCKNQNSPQL